jgi:hypothetical protein
MAYIIKKLDFGCMYIVSNLKFKLQLFQIKFLSVIIIKLRIYRITRNSIQSLLNCITISWSRHATLVSTRGGIPRCFMRFCGKGSALNAVIFSHTSDNTCCAAIVQLSHCWKATLVPFVNGDLVPSYWR